MTTILQCYLNMYKQKREFGQEVLLTSFTQVPLITSITPSQTCPIDTGTLVYVTAMSTCFFAFVTIRPSFTS